MKMKRIILGTSLVAAGVLLGAATAIAVQINFSDVQQNDWFYGDVQSMTDIGVIKGYSDNTYRPANSVNRAEVAAMLNRFNNYVKTQCYSKTEIDAMFRSAGLADVLPTHTNSSSVNNNTNTNSTTDTANSNQNSTSSTSTETNNLYDVLKDTPEVSSFFSAVSQHPDLVSALKDESKKFTIIAPTNSASKLNTILSDKNKLAHHISTYWASESDIIIMYDATEFETLSGTSFTFQKNEAGKYTINGKVLQFVEPTRFADNGTILVFDNIIE